MRIYALESWQDTITVVEVAGRDLVRELAEALRVAGTIIDSERRYTVATTAEIAKWARRQLDKTVVAPLGAALAAYSGDLYEQRNAAIVDQRSTKLSRSKWKSDELPALRGSATPLMGPVASGCGGMTSCRGARPNVSHGRAGRPSARALQSAPKGDRSRACPASCHGPGYSRSPSG